MATCVAGVLFRRHCGLAWIVGCNRQQSRNVATKSKLQMVGKLAPKKDGKYPSGQLFVHSIFGYRGVVLFPWMAKIYDRDIPGNKKDKLLSKLEASKSKDPQLNKDPDAESMIKPDTNKEVQAKTQVYYQVLMDFNDLPHIRAESEGVTFLGNRDQGSSRLYRVVGLDNVSHDDVLPYVSSEIQPIQHDLFDKFLEHAAGNDPPYMPITTLKEWKTKNHPFLELSEVHRETTENIRVTVTPFYLGAESYEGKNYHWRYCVRIENLGDKAVQLRERSWKIFSISGTLENVKDRGVQGVEPVLSSIHAGHSAFQYTSHVTLKSPSGHMWGSYRMEREDGIWFDARIPPFSLESKEHSNPDPHGGVFG
ncbi:polymerase delta-interacting protein 2-like [Amphiura filiformis]|uniref:polymerase delta-interacting protein 2-like n=1 Tax=Amphiura filiformis TaxID=82378 RepID=UPI003B2205DC